MAPVTMSAVGGALRGIQKVAMDTRNSKGFEPAEDSPAALQEKSADVHLRTLLEKSTALATLGLVAAEDCLSAAGRLMQDGNPYAPVPILRTASELSARAWWLCEPGSDPIARVERFLADRWNGLDELRKVPTVAAINEPFWDEVQALSEAASAAGIKVQSRRGGLPGASRPRPKTDALIRKMIETAPQDVRAARNYSARIIGGFAHGEAFALESLVGPLSENGEVEINRIEHGFQLLILLSAMPVMFYLLAIRRYLPLLGWELGTWESQLVETLKFIGLYGAADDVAADS